MEIIDIDSWDRKEHFRFFRNMSHPHFSLCFDLDITSLRRHVKERELPFNQSLVYYLMHCVNGIDEFKYRYRDGMVVRHDLVYPSFTALDPQTKLFRIHTVPRLDSLSGFLSECELKARTQAGIVDPGMEARDDLVYMTSIPWISFTSISHPIALGIFDSIPRLSWGKYETRNGAVMLAFSVQANHAFVDGYHVGLLKEAIDGNMDRLDAVLA